MNKNNLKIKIVIFGGSGFLGSHIADQLSEKNYTVHIFDIIKSRYLKKNQKMIIGDITNYNQVEKAIKKMNFVLHFAAVSDIDEANKNPMKTIKCNILGTTNILEAIRENKKVKKMIYASSIYARSKDGGFYSTSKRSTESIIENYYDNFKINFVILRFGSLYGTRSNFFNPINNYIKQAFKSKKIERFGEGSDIRSYINVKDAAKICINIMESQNKNKYFNILGKKRIEVKKIMQIIAKKMNVTKVSFKKEKNNSLHYKVNPFTYKVKNGIFIKTKNEINLDEGINEMISNYKTIERIK